MKLVWIAYCITCKGKVYKCPNGEFVEAAAKLHMRDYERHRVIVGYELKKERK